MFKPIPNARPSSPVRIELDGQPHEVPADLNVAAAVLMLSGPAHYRQTADGQPRAPYCMMGVCHECLVTIDGEPNQQGCLARVRPGMRITTQGGWSE